MSISNKSVSLFENGDFEMRISETVILKLISKKNVRNLFFDQIRRLNDQIRRLNDQIRRLNMIK